MKKCEACGKNYSDGYDVCPYCGGRGNGETIRVDSYQKRVEDHPVPANTKFALGLIIGAVIGAGIVLAIFLLIKPLFDRPTTPGPIVEEIEVGESSVDGVVCEAEDRSTPVDGAEIGMYTAEANALYTTQNSGNDGSFDIQLPPDRYMMIINEPEHIEFTAYPSVDPGQQMHMGTILLIRGEEGDVGGAAGTINNAQTGEPIAQATLDFLKGWYAFIPGVTNLESESLAKTTTNDEGQYTVELPIGNYTVVISGDGLVQNQFNIIVKEGVTEEQNGTVEPTVDENSDAINDYLVTLSWGASPRDLDLHTVGKFTNGNSFHVYFSDMRANNATGENVCNLDVDDTSSYGPEHITLKTEHGEPYYFYVHQFSGDGSLQTSGATITISRNNQVVRTFNVPTSSGSGIYWNVFAIKDGRIITKDTITSSPDTGYAN